MPPIYSLMWLWFWFIIGELLYWLKRAYYLITGPNPIANDYKQFLDRCWAPLLVRGVTGAGVYWATFYPEVFSGMLKLVGWNVSFHSPIPHYAVVALFFGLGIDNALDLALSKIPIVKEWLPQMPGPLPKSQQSNPPKPEDRKAEGM